MILKVTTGHSDVLKHTLSDIKVFSKQIMVIFTHTHTHTHIYITQILLLLPKIISVNFIVQVNTRIT